MIEFYLLMLRKDKNLPNKSLDSEVTCDKFKT
jgi:hypothetical protein